MTPLRPWWRRLFRKPRPPASQPVGARGEKAAAQYLRRHGYRILAKNLRTPSGEIDILAEAPDHRTVVIVEVKAASRPSQAFPPELHVTDAKKRKLVTLAAQIARQRRLTDRPLRFDVIAIDFNPDAPPDLRHHVGAFTSHV